MTDQALKIFVVDDEPLARMSIKFDLDDSAFKVTEFDNGEDCLAALDEAPDILLLDVGMPGMDGIAVCRAIRAAGNDQVQVIFISGHDDLDTRLAAYDAGGNDYMVKPYAPEELDRKLRLAEQVLESKRGLAGQATYAQQVAFTAMSSMGEMGAVLEFMRASFACPTVDALAQALTHVLQQYDLQGLVELRDGAVAHCYSTKGVCTALESSILGHARTLQRIFKFHDRLAINYPRITLLALNLPLDDPDRIGRLRDHLAILAEAAEARLASMESEARRQIQGEGIGHAVAELTHALAEIEVRQGENRMRSLEATNTYLHELDQAFIHLGLSGSQEDELVGMARNAVARIGDLLEKDKALGDTLREITKRLQGLVAV
jgi:CheY-like chemotaxis protein